MADLVHPFRTAPSTDRPSREQILDRIELVFEHFLLEKRGNEGAHGARLAHLRLAGLGPGSPGVSAVLGLVLARSRSGATQAGRDPAEAVGNGPARQDAARQGSGDTERSELEEGTHNERVNKTHPEAGSSLA